MRFGFFRLRPNDRQEQGGNAEVNERKFGAAAMRLLPCCADVFFSAKQDGELGWNVIGR
jgi:hypothetical protein